MLYCVSHTTFKSVMRVFSCVAFTFLIYGCSDKRPDLPPADLFLPSDLEATVWAESPLFYNPTNMDVDLKGRIWITEAVNYRNFNNDSTHTLHHSAGDRVMIVEDTDNDGKADTSKVFVQDKDLVSPLGIAVIGNRIIVSCSPHMIVYTDANGDDVPDKKEIFLTGFGGLDHDHSLHAVVEGPDGKWYFNTGNAGPHVVTDKSGWTLCAGSIYTGGSPYNTTNHGNMKSDDAKIWVGGLSLRINPDGTGMKVMGHNFRNSYESTVDSYGNLWQNDNDDQVVACRTSWLMEGGNAGYFSTDGSRYWQADQRPWQDIFTAHWHQDDPGVMPAGDKSGAGAPTGIAFYESDVLGKQYQGMLFSADAGRNVVFGYKPSYYQSGYQLGPRSNFLTSLPEDNEGYVWNDTAQNNNRDKWFRPSDVVVGTDGTLYVADWFDPVVGGHQMGDSIGYGRIFRIKPKSDNPTSPRIRLDTWSGLMKAFANPAVHVRALAANVMREKGEESISHVQKLLRSGNGYEQARAIWLLSQLGEKGKQQTIKLLDDKDPRIRSTAFRALRQTGDNVLPYAEKLSHDTSSFVRREVAIGLRDLPFSKTKSILLSLARHVDAKDKWYLESISSACKGHEAEFYRDLAKAGLVVSQPDKWNDVTAALAFELHPDFLVKDLQNRAASATSEPARTQALTALAAINTTDAVHAMLDLARSSLKDVSEKATYWAAFRQGNEWFSLIDWDKTGIDTRHARKLAEMQVKISKVLDQRLPFDEKKWNIQDLARDSVGGQILIGFIAAHKIPQELYPFVEDLIFKNPDLSVRIQATSYFKRPRNGKTYSIPAITALKSDAGEGRAIFEKTCAACHRVNKKGSDTGPDLTLIHKKFDKPALLDAIVNPSAGIVFGYEPWLITSKSGESFFGFLVADGDKTVVIKDMAGRRHVVPTQSIATRTKQDNSMMPEPSSFGLTEQNLSDIAAYLMKLE